MFKVKKTLKAPFKIIRYFGSKGNMWREIGSFFPSNYRMYIEPFGGSGTMLFCQKAEIEIYNDIEQNIYTLFKVVADKKLFAEFKARLDLMLYSERLREECKEQLKCDVLDDVDRAICYFYTNYTSHSGMGGFSMHTTEVRRNMSKSVSDYLSKIDGLPEIHQRLSSVIISNKNAFDLFDRYDAENTFYYLDPPYHWSTRGVTRYTIDFTDEQHTNLINKVLTMKSKILISGYDCEEYNQLTNNGWNKHCFKVNVVDGTNSAKTKVETLWYNYAKRD